MVLFSVYDLIPGSRNSRYTYLRVIGGFFRVISHSQGLPDDSTTRKGRSFEIAFIAMQMRPYFCYSISIIKLKLKNYDNSSIFFSIYKSA